MKNTTYNCPNDMKINQNTSIVLLQRKHRSIRFLSLVLILFMFGLLTEFSKASYASGGRRLTLDEAVAIAREKSPDALAARHRYRGSYWQYRSHLAGFLPHLRLDATLPNLNRSISPITLPDGSDAFVRRSLASSSGTLSLSQNIGLTGGQLFVTSGLQRIDLIRDDNTLVSYLATPVNIGLRQPIFAHNPYRWQQQIEPLRYKEAQKTYTENLEDIAIRATQNFFDLLIAQINLEINLQTLSTNDTLFQIARARFDLGRITESDLLQMELNVLNAKATLEQTRIDHEAAMFRFRSFLGLGVEETISLIAPEIIPQIHIELSTALAQARKNRSDLVAFQRQVLEAGSEVSQAKADNRFNANIFAVYGLTGSAANLSGAYQDPLDHQQLVIGISIPILDWGVGRGKVRMAESNRDLISTEINQAIEDFQQEIFVRVMEFNALPGQLNIAYRANTIAQRRFDVSRERFLIGRIDIVELNFAIEAKELARTRHILALRNFWLGFYEMRRLTLFDFLLNKPIVADFENL